MVYLSMIKKDTVPTIYLSGTCIRTEDGLFYIRGNKRYRIISDRILRSQAFPRVIKTTEDAVSKYRIAGRLGFRSGSILLDIADNTFWYIEDTKRRHIMTPDVLNSLGVSYSKVPLASRQELEIHEQGEDII